MTSREAGEVGTEHAGAWHGHGAARLMDETDRLSQVSRLTGRRSPKHDSGIPLAVVSIDAPPAGQERRYARVRDGETADVGHGRARPALVPVDRRTARGITPAVVPAG